MAAMQQPGAPDRPAGARLDRRDARLLLVALTILAGAIGTAVVFTQSRAQKTTIAGIPATLRFSGAPDPIAAGTDALWVGLNPALDRELQTGEPAQTQKFGSLERVSLTSGAIERTLWIPGFVGPAALHLGTVLWINHNDGPDRTGPGELDALDWNSGRLLGRVPFDRGVFDLAYGDGSLWVTVGTSPATLVRVDPATRQTIGKPIVIAPRRAFGSAFGSGAVWETGFDDGSLTRIDPLTGNIDRVKLGGAAVGVVVSDGTVWVALRDRRTVIRVAPRTLRVVHTIRVGDNPAYLAAAGGLIWVVNQTDGTVTRIDARTGRTVGLPLQITPDDASNLTTAGRSVWVASDRHASASRIDLNQAGGTSGSSTEQSTTSTLSIGSPTLRPAELGTYVRSHAPVGVSTALTLSADGHYTQTIAGRLPNGIQGDWSFRDGMITFKETSGSDAECLGQPGTYSWSFANMTLSLTIVNDPCQPRSGDFRFATWRRQP